MRSDDQTPLLLRPAGSGLYHWRLGEASGEDSCEAIATRHSGGPIVLALAAEEVLLRHLPLAPGERRHAAQSVPYMLEEELSEELGQLQVALAPPSADGIVAAVVQRTALQAQIDTLQRAQLTPTLCVPEQQLLPRPAGGWGATASGERLVVHSASGQSCVCNAANATELLELLAAQSAPQRIRLRVDAEQRDTVITWFPPQLRACIEVVPTRAEDGLSEAIQALEAEDVVNLLQGDFALRDSWDKLWSRWRMAAVLLVGNVLLYSMVAHSDLHRLRQEASQLGAAIATVHSEFFDTTERRPQQAREAFERIAGNAGTSGTQRSYVLPLLERVAIALREQPGSHLYAVQYQIKQAEALQVEIETAGFAHIAAIRKLFDKHGLETQMLGSNALRNKRVRVRFLCRLGNAAQ